MRNPLTRLRRRGEENEQAIDEGAAEQTAETSPVATFNQITAVGDPRTVQFGLRLMF